jgi:hypothetical protein
MESIRGMMRMSTRTAWSLALVVAASLTGCICNDGVFTYYGTVKVRDTGGQPVEHLRTFLTDDETDQAQTYAEQAPARIAVTDTQGLATPMAVTDLCWGGCPGPSEAPVPPNPDIVYLWVEHPQQGWQRYDLVIQDTQITGRRPAELDIDLETLILNP